MGDGFSIQQVRGNAEKLAKRLHAEAQRDMRLGIRRALVDATKPTRQAVKQATLERLPKRGGLNRWAAVLPTLTTDFRADTASIKITQRKRGHDLKALDEGHARHPVFGHRKAWVEQSVQGGFFTDTMRAEGPAVGRRTDAAIQKHLDNLGRAT